MAEELALRNTLIREVHHRIKNHLQGIVMLIGNASLDEEPDQVLKKVINQVRTIATVYGLQAQERDEKIHLAKLISSCVGLYDKTISFNLENDLESNCQDELASQESVPIALIVNELIVNAEKHSAALENPKIDVLLSCNSCTAKLSISNPVKGLPENFDFLRGTGLGTGLNLLRTLLPKQGATLTFLENDSVLTVELCLDPPVIIPVKST